MRAEKDTPGYGFAYRSWMSLLFFGFDYNFRYYGRHEKNKNHLPFVNAHPE